MNLRKSLSSTFVFAASLLVAVPLVQVADVTPALAESKLEKDLEQQVQKIAAAAQTIAALAAQPLPPGLLVDFTEWNKQSDSLRALGQALSKRRADFQALLLKVKANDAGQAEAKALSEKFSAFVTNARTKLSAQKPSKDEMKARQTAALAALDGIM